LHSDAPVPRRFLDATLPGETPLPFAPGFVDTDAVELNSVIAPDGREFFFTRVINEQFVIFRSVLQGDAWSTPAPLHLFPTRANAMAVDMALSPDGQSLYFLSDHPHEHASGAPGEDLWVSRRVDGEWAVAEALPPPVRTDATEIYATVVADGSIYFSSDRDGETKGRNQLYRAQRLPDGKFDVPVRLGPPIENELGTGDTFVAPDESYMVFASRRAPSQGGGDLFCSFRLTDGSWSEPKNMGPQINTADHEYCPMMSPDRKYLFFSRRYGDSWETTTGGDVFWVNAVVLEKLRPSSPR
jgi:hypothetical protein